MCVRGASSQWKVVIGKNLHTHTHPLVPYATCVYAFRVCLLGGRRTPDHASFVRGGFCTRADRKKGLAFRAKGHMWGG